MYKFHFPEIDNKSRCNHALGQTILVWNSHFFGEIRLPKNVIRWYYTTVWPWQSHQLVAICPWRSRESPSGDFWLMVKPQDLGIPVVQQMKTNVLGNTVGGKGIWPPHGLKGLRVRELNDVMFVPQTSWAESECVKAWEGSITGDPGPPLWCCLAAVVGNLADPLCWRSYSENRMLKAMTTQQSAT